MRIRRERRKRRPKLKLNGEPRKLYDVSKRQPGTVRWMGQGQASIRDLAKLTSVSVSHLSRVFRGERKPSVLMLRMLSMALRVPMEKLDDALELTRREWKLEQYKRKSLSPSTAPPSLPVMPDQAPGVPTGENAGDR